jgi:hypothetical protein
MGQPPPRNHHKPDDPDVFKRFVKSLQGLVNSESILITHELTRDVPHHNSTFFHQVIGFDPVDSGIEE